MKHEKHRSSPILLSLFLCRSIICLYTCQGVTDLSVKVSVKVSRQSPLGQDVSHGLTLKSSILLEMA